MPREPYADGITDVVRDLQAAGGGSEQPAARAARRRCARSAQVDHRRRPRIVRRLQHHRDPRRPRREMRVHEAQGRHTSLVTVGRKAEGYFRFRDYRSTRAFTGFSDSPTYEDARRVAPRWSGGSRPARSTSSSSSTRASSRPAARRSSSGRCCRSTRGDRGAGGGVGWPERPTTSSSRSRSDSRDAAAALRRSADLRRAAQCGGVGARVPVSAR